MKKIAVAIIHGMGNQPEDYAFKLSEALQKRFKERCGDQSAGLIIKPIFWADVFSKGEEELYDQTVASYDLNFKQLRKFVISYFGDAIAYQPVETAKHNYYRVHEKVASGLKQLSEKAGDNSPLCVIAHSLGTVIASNYFYDLQFKTEAADDVNPSSPLEKGETLSLFYTLGTPMPLWSLRYHDFDRPITIPSPEWKQKHPDMKGEWINFYDRDDVLSFPLKSISPSYALAVDQDKEVNCGTIFTSWNPLSHNGYFTSQEVIHDIIEGLFRIWVKYNSIK